MPGPIRGPARIPRQRTLNAPPQVRRQRLRVSHGLPGASLHEKVHKRRRTRGDFRVRRRIDRVEELHRRGPVGAHRALDAARSARRGVRGSLRSLRDRGGGGGGGFTLRRRSLRGGFLSRLLLGAFSPELPGERLGVRDVPGLVVDALTLLPDDVLGEVVVGAAAASTFPARSLPGHEG